MGFGTLFIGFFFTLNFAYPGFTDAIAGIIMLYGAYQLSSINKSFKLGATFTLVFTVFGVAELGFEIYDMFTVASADPTLVSVLSALRYVSIALLSLFMLLGMRDVAREVKLQALAVKCERVAVMTLPVYLICIILEILGLFQIKESVALNIAAVIMLVCNIAVTVMSLICIYRCYARICMPGKNDSDEPKESRFAFVNAFRRHEEEKQREYAEYRLAKFKAAQEKKKRKNKK